MQGGQAKILSDLDLKRLLKVASQSRHPHRNKAIALLSVRAGLRASEIAHLEWSMVTDGGGTIANMIELPGSVTKYGLSRRIPLHADLKRALSAIHRHQGRPSNGPVIASERFKGERYAAMTPKAIVNWFTSAYRQAGLCGCSSHSGRRTFITRAARLVAKAGGSLRDVQQLAGHRSIDTTQGYIDGDSEIQRRIIRMM